MIAETIGPYLMCHAGFYFQIYFSRMVINKLSTDTWPRSEHLGKIRSRQLTQLPGGVCFAWGNFLPMGIKRLYGHHGNCCHGGLPSSGSADVTVCHGQQCVHQSSECDRRWLSVFQQLQSIHVRTTERTVRDTAETEAEFHIQDLAHLP